MEGMMVLLHELPYASPPASALITDIKNSKVSPEPNAIYNVSYARRLAVANRSRIRTDELTSYDIRSTISLTSRKRRCRDAFADKLLECRQRHTIYSKHPDLLNHVSSNARNRKRVNNLLRQELMIALMQCKIPLPREAARSRFECRVAYEEAVRVSQFRLMDLPKELRILIYEHALRQDEPLDATEGWPALARVSRQLQQEATDVIVRVNCIQLSINHSTYPSESKECSKLEHIDSRHTDWLKSIGSEAVAKLRRICSPMDVIAPSRSICLAQMLPSGLKKEC
ncbi:hypothetical protein E4T47_05674 [Aureobasidium subglaciale]|nr:hypothetical protein E4T47_05674 [Aureobasidium subglaciale]